jgi:kynureninase
MAYSGTRTFNLQIEEIIEEAFERCGLEVLGGYDLKTARRSLNLMFSEWANRGLNLWTIDYGTTTMVVGKNFYTLDQKVVDVVDAVITTTTDATANIEGDSDTTDVAITKISRTEYMNLSRKEQTSTGDARPTQFTVINGQVTTSGGSDYGRPEI